MWRNLKSTNLRKYSQSKDKPAVLQGRKATSRKRNENEI